MTRALPESAYLALKAATRRLVKAGGGVEHCQTRVGKTTLSDYGNVEKREFAPIDVIADLEADVGEPYVSAVLIRLLEDGQRPAKQADCNPVGLGAEVMVHLGRYAEEARKAAEDSIIEDHELTKLIRQAEQLRIASEHLHDHLCREEKRRKGCK